MSDDYVRVPRALVERLREARARVNALDAEATGLYHVPGKARQYNALLDKIDKAKPDVRAAESELGDAALDALERADKEDGT